MPEQNVISEESVISAEETKKLIERLSDPSFKASQNQTTVKDLAETLDLDPNQVASYLWALRAENSTVSIRETEEAKANNFIPSHNQPYAKLAAVMIFTVLGVMVIMFYFLWQPSAVIDSPPTPRPIIEAVPGSQRGPEPGSAPTADLKDKSR